MQKKIIALAVAGLVSGGAFAQSNVTISGNMEAHFESVSANGATAANANRTSRTRVTDNTSALRLAGSENLGNGMTAWFQVESDMGIDNSAAGTAGAAGFGNRNTAVGLSGSFGNVLLGHWDAHYQAQLEGGVDFGSSGALPHSANSMNLTSQVNGVGLIGNRLSNVIAYISPVFSGFQARLAYAAGGTDAVENMAAGLPGKNSGWNLFAKYGNGPVNAFWSHLDVRNAGANGTAGAVCVNNATGVISVAAGAACGAGTTLAAAVAIAAGQGNDVKSDKLGFAWTFPMGLKVGIVYDTTKVNAAAGGALAAKRNAWSLPISYTTGPHGVYFSYAKAGDVSTAAGTTANTNAKNTVLGYTYSMSKRTSVGVSYSVINNESAAAYDFWTRGVGPAAGADPKSFAMGINHTF